MVFTVGNQLPKRLSDALVENRFSMLLIARFD